MTSFPNSPKLVRGGIVLIDPASASVQRIIALQYNSDSLSRTLQVQAVGEAAGDRSQALRIKGPAIETFKLEAEIDATDQLEFPSQNPNATQYGILPQLAALETLIYPESATLLANNALAGAGTLEIAPMEAPLALFIWSRNRIVPVRVSELSITEEAFDAALNPIRAKVSLSLRALSVDDLGFDNKGGGLFMSYLKAKEKLVAKVPAAQMSAFGIGGLP
jgi:hypothetical protein